jgi:hypothetical protein
MQAEKQSGRSVATRLDLTLIRYEPMLQSGGGLLSPSQWSLSDYLRHTTSLAT